MNALVRYGPWEVMPRFEQNFNRLWNSFLGEDSAASQAQVTWLPDVDVHEYSDRYEIFVDLPGVDPAKVDLTLAQGVLTISGERPFVTAEGEQPQVNRSERSYGRFVRTILLPDTIDSEKISATERHGALAIRIAKHEQALPRRIAVAA